MQALKSQHSNQKLGKQPQFGLYTRAKLLLLSFTDIKIFEDKKVRMLWDAEHEKWYLSIVDVITVLTDSPNPQVYWRVLKKRFQYVRNTYKFKRKGKCRIPCGMYY